MTPEYEAADAEIFRENTVDFIGCNYYQPLRIQAPLPQNGASNPFEPRQLFRGYDWPEKNQSSSWLGNLSRRDLRYCDASEE